MTRTHRRWVGPAPLRSAPIAVCILLSIVLSGCQFAGAAGALQGQLVQQLPGLLTTPEEIAVDTLIIRYEQLQRLRAVLDGQTAPLPPLPMPVPSPSPPPPGPTPQGLR